VTRTKLSRNSLETLRADTGELSKRITYPQQHREQGLKQFMESQKSITSFRKPGEDDDFKYVELWKKIMFFFVNLQNLFRISPQNLLCKTVFQKTLGNKCERSCTVEGNDPRV